LAGLTLDYGDVARWISQLHEYAGLLSRVHLTIGLPPVATGDA
jgi:hypothetical protein